MRRGGPRWSSLFPRRDHTERMLTYFGAEISVKDEDDGRRAVTVRGDAELGGASIAVPGDPSSAAFAIAAALICEGSDIVLEGVLMNPTRAASSRRCEKWAETLSCSTFALKVASRRPISAFGLALSAALTCRLGARRA